MVGLETHCLYCCGKAVTFPGCPVSVGHLHVECFHLGDLEIHSLAPGSLAVSLFASHPLLGPSVVPSLSERSVHFQS